MTSGFPPDWECPAAAAETRWLRAPPSTGAVVAFVLYGVYLVLHAQYVASPLYARLNGQVKAALWTVASLLSAHTVLVAVDVVDWTTTTNRTFLHYMVSTKLEAVLPAVGGAVAASVQTLLLLRAVSTFRNEIFRRCFTAFMLCAILVTFVGSILSTVAFFLYFHDAQPVGPHLDLNHCFAWWLWCMVGVDWSLTGVLAFTLRQRVAGFNKNTDSLLNKLVLAALQTAAYTSILAFVGAVLAVVYDPVDLRYAYLPWMFGPPLPACYGISLYTTLSTRRLIETHLGGPATLRPAAWHDGSRVRERREGRREEGMDEEQSVSSPSGTRAVAYARTVEVRVDESASKEEKRR